MSTVGARRVAIDRDRYFDSVTLMRLSTEIGAVEGVIDGAVVLGTDANLAALRQLGFVDAELDSVGSTDLIVAIAARDRPSADAAVDAAFERLASLTAPTDQADRAGRRPRSVREAAAGGAATLALISVPGRYAAREARRALDAGLHVMLFSDNVTLQDEAALKEYAGNRGLLLMGPDCGTALIGGAPLGFANQVRPGPVGIVGASGTGTQEICCLVHTMGSGISHAIGTGGRDLRDPAIGGRTALAAIAELSADPDTSVIVVVSKPPFPEIADRVVAALRESGKPAVVHFLGLPVGKSTGEVRWAHDLTDAAARAVTAATGHAPTPLFDEARLAAVAREQAAQLPPRRRYLRGLFTGGTLADETLFHLGTELGGIPVLSNIHPSMEHRMQDPRVSVGHAIIDLGDDEFTVGKPHPMIDPQARADRLVAELQDVESAVLLLDLVLGHGSHSDPAGPVVAALQECSSGSVDGPRVVVSVTGTDIDPQGKQSQVEALQAAGCLVMPSNIWAARLAGAIVTALGSRQ